METSDVITQTMRLSFKQHLKGRKFRGILISRITEMNIFRGNLISRLFIDFRKFGGNLNSRVTTNYVCSFIVDNYQNKRFNSSNLQLFYLFYLITSKKVK